MYQYSMNYPMYQPDWYQYPEQPVMGNPYDYTRQQQNQIQVPTPTPTPTPTGQADMAGLEQSYVENILRFNRGKMVTVYMTFENNPEWPAKIFRGVLEEAGRDHIIITNRRTGESYLLLMVHLDYVEFEEPIEYIPPTLPEYVQTENEAP